MIRVQLYAGDPSCTCEMRRRRTFWRGHFSHFSFLIFLVLDERDSGSVSGFTVVANNAPHLFLRSPSADANGTERCCHAVRLVRCAGNEQALQSSGKQWRSVSSVSVDVGSCHALQGGLVSARLDKKDKRGRVQAFRVHIGVHGIEDGTPLRGEGWWPLWDSVS